MKQIRQNVQIENRIDKAVAINILSELLIKKDLQQASLSSMRLPKGNAGGATMKGFRVFVKIKRG